MIFSCIPADVSLQQLLLQAALMPATVAMRTVSVITCLVHVYFLHAAGGVNVPASPAAAGIACRHSPVLASGAASRRWLWYIEQRTPCAVG
jgi:hypothetical protein